MAAALEAAADADDAPEEAVEAAPEAEALPLTAAAQISLLTVRVSVVCFSSVPRYDLIKKHTGLITRRASFGYAWCDGVGDRSLASRALADGVGEATTRRRNGNREAVKLYNIISYFGNLVTRSSLRRSGGKHTAQEGRSATLTAKA